MENAADCGFIADRHAHDFRRLEDFCPCGREYEQIAHVLVDFVGRGADEDIVVDLAWLVGILFDKDFLEAFGRNERRIEDEELLFDAALQVGAVRVDRDLEHGLIGFDAEWRERCGRRGVYHGFFGIEDLGRQELCSERIGREIGRRDGVFVGFETHVERPRVTERAEFVDVEHDFDGEVLDFEQVLDEGPEHRGIFASGHEGLDFVENAGLQFDETGCVCHEARELFLVGVGLIDIGHLKENADILRWRHERVEAQEQGKCLVEAAVCEVDAGHLFERLDVVRVVRENVLKDGNGLARCIEVFDEQRGKRDPRLEGNLGETRVGFENHFEDASCVVPMLLRNLDLREFPHDGRIVVLQFEYLSIFDGGLHRLVEIVEIGFGHLHVPIDLIFFGNRASMELHQRVDGGDIVFFLEEFDEFVANFHLCRREHECLFEVFSGKIGFVERVASNAGGFEPGRDAGWNVLDLLCLHGEELAHEFGIAELFGHVGGDAEGRQVRRILLDEVANF